MECMSRTISQAARRTCAVLKIQLATFPVVISVASCRCGKMARTSCQPPCASSRIGSSLSCRSMRHVCRHMSLAKEQLTVVVGTSQLCGHSCVVAAAAQQLSVAHFADGRANGEFVPSLPHTHAQELPHAQVLPSTHPCPHECCNQL